MVVRRAININLGDEEYLELRHILLAEGISLSEFFGRCAKQYIVQNQRKVPRKEASEKPRNK